jgi:hypothetical protein
VNANGNEIDPSKNDNPILLKIKDKIKLHWDLHVVCYFDSGGVNEIIKTVDTSNLTLNPILTKIRRNKDEKAFCVAQHYFEP